MPFKIILRPPAYLEDGSTDVTIELRDKHSDRLITSIGVVASRIVTDPDLLKRGWHDAKNKFIEYVEEAFADAIQAESQTDTENLLPP